MNTAYEQALPASLDTWEGQRDSAPLPLISFALGLFVISACTISYTAEGSMTAKVIGWFLGLLFVGRMLRKRVHISPEVILYAAWTGWSLLALLSGEVITLAFWPKWGTVVQITIMMIILADFCETRKTLSFNFAMYLIAAAIVAGVTLLSGEAFKAEESGERAKSMVANPNTLGYEMLLATECLAYFWMVSRKWGIFGKVVLVGAFSAAALVTVISGSRKAILGLALFYLLWVFFCYGKRLFRQPLLLLAVVLGLGLGGFAFFQLVKDSPVGQRFQLTIDYFSGKEVRNQDAGQGRLWLYEKGFETLWEYPVFGVGHDNFALRSGTGRMTHVEFLEVACNTGIPGMCLYASIYVVLWFRASRIAKYAGDPTTARIARLIHVFLLVSLAVSLGRTDFATKEHWVVTAGFIGWTSAVWRDIRERRALDASAQPAEFDFAR